MNISKLLLCTLLVCLYTNASFGMLNDVEKIFYTDNKWSYLEKEFVDKPEMTFKLFTVCAVVVLMAGTTLSISIPLSINMDDVDESSLRILQGLSLTTVLFIFLIILANKKYTENNIIFLKKFFQNYYPYAVTPSMHNNKDFIPPEFAETFDLLYQKYKTDGDQILESFGFTLLEQIKSEIKKRNNTKYQAPL